jgi:uncharacterized protein YraI
MKFRNTLIVAAAASAVALSGAVAAGLAATAVTPLNIRSGPGPQFPVIGYIPQNTPAVLVGCMQSSFWCQVDYNGTVGWSDAEYLTTRMDGRMVPVFGSVAQVPTVTYQVATVGSAPAPAPVISGTLVRRSATGAPLVITPPPNVQEYVVANPAPPVYLNGEVVQGAALPPDVRLNPVPNYQYEYAYVNGVPVLVEPQSRQVLYVYR